MSKTPAERKREIPLSQPVSPLPPPTDSQTRRLHPAWARQRLAEWPEFSMSTAHRGIDRAWVKSLYDQITDCLQDCRELPDITQIALEEVAADSAEGAIPGAEVEAMLAVLRVWQATQVFDYAAEVDEHTDAKGSVASSTAASWQTKSHEPVTIERYWTRAQINRVRHARCQKTTWRGYQVQAVQALLADIVTLMEQQQGQTGLAELTRRKLPKVFAEGYSPRHVRALLREIRESSPEG